MDAFFASAEQLRHPHLQQKPVVITSNLESPTIIAASYEAKALGFKVGTRYVPHQSVTRLAASPSYYMQISKRLMSLLHQHFTPRIEVFSVDEAFLDFSDQKYLYQNPEDIVRAVKSLVEQEIKLPFSIGLSINKSLAKVASEHHKPLGVCIIPPEKVATFLHDLPVEKFCGIGDSMQALLANYGVHTCSQMQNIPISILSQRFGQIGRQIWWMCQGVDHRDLILKPAHPKSLSNSKVIPPSSKSDQIISAYFLHICWKLAKRLRQKRLRSNHFVIQLKYYKNSKQSFEYKTGHFTNRFEDIKPLYTQALRQAKGKIRHIAIIALKPQDIKQHDLLMTNTHNNEHIVDQVNSVFGADTLQTTTHLLHNIKKYVISFNQKPNPTSKNPSE